MAANPALAVGDTVCLADGAQLMGFARVTKTTPKTAVADLLGKQGVTVPDPSGVPGRDDYIPGGALGMEVTLTADGFVRTGADVKGAFCAHKMKWVRYPGRPVSRLLYSDSAQ